MIFLARIFKCPSESGLLLHTITEKGNMSLAGVFKRPGEGGFQYYNGKGENISRQSV